MSVSPSEDEDFEHSTLSGPVSHDGETIDLEIYHCAGSQAAWRMDGVDMRGGCTRWAQRFTTEQNAYEAFKEFVAEHGRTVLTGRGSDPQH